MLVAFTTLDDDAYEVRTSALQALAPELLNNPRPFDVLEHWAGTIIDPYFRCLALLELCQWRPTHAAELLNAAQASASVIRDPVRQFIALDKLIPFFPDQASAMSKKLITLLRNKNFPDRYRAEAWMHMTIHTLPDEHRAMLEQALKAADRVQDKRSRTMLLREIGPRIMIDPHLRKTFNAAVAKLKDPFHQALATRQLSLMVQHFATRFVQPDAQTTINLAILGLAAAIEDAQQNTLTDDQFGLWADLFQTDRQDAIVKILDQGAATGFTLNAQRTNVLDYLINLGELADVLALLAVGYTPEPTVLPIVERWAAHTNPELVRHARLLLAEAGKLTPNIAAELLTILQSDDDRMRYRAAVALHGTADSSETNRRYRVSQIGRQSVEIVTEAVLPTSMNNVGIVSTVLWFFHNLVQDDPSSIDRWIEEVNDFERGDIAQKILSGIEFLTTEVLDQLIQRLPSAPPAAQRALVQSFGRMAYLKQLPDSRWPALLTALHALAPETLADIVFIRNGAGQVAQALLLAFQQLHEGQLHLDVAIVTLISKLPEQYETLAALADADHSVAQDLLSALGSTNYWSGTYREQIRVAAAQLPDNTLIFQLLQAWIVRLDPPIHKVDQRITEYVLDIAVAMAERAPAAFANLDQQEALEYRLVEIATLHRGFVERMAAVTLLGRMRRVSPKTISAFLAAMHSSPYEQQAALDAAMRQRVIPDEYLTTLLEGLSDVNASRVYAVAQILRALTRNNKLPPQHHTHIAFALVEAIKHLGKQSRRDVYLMTGDWRDGGGQFTIEHRGQLDETLYEVLVQISEIVGVGRGSSLMAASETDVETHTIRVPASRREQREMVSVTIGAGAILGNDHPLQHQMKWLSNQGYTLDTDVNNAIEAIGKIASEHNVPLISLLEAVVNDGEEDEEGSL